MNFLLSLLLAINISYGSPVNYEIALAGNFGEPRVNHFHGGIDVKTDGVEGKAIFSIGDGYISHVSVGLHGFGNAVYVRHPEGYTSVYCHLKKFTPQIQAMVLKWQYSNRKSNGDIYFKPTDFLVSRGQLIAISGNTGSSQAPHLHLEIHETRTWNMLDPLDFIGGLVKDDLPPMAHGFMAYPIKGQGVFCGTDENKCFPFTSYSLSRNFSAWGSVGFGIWANDYMEATYNRYGVRKTELFVDNKMVFSSVVDNISTEDNMMINAWGDYEHFLHTGVWYLKSFVSPGMYLPILKANEDNGIINFNEERNYYITYVVTDIKGNSRKYAFVVQGIKTNIPKSTKNQHSQKNILVYNRGNNFQLPGFQLSFGKKYLVENVELHPQVTFQENKISDIYKLMPHSYPLLKYANIALRLKKQVPDVSKLYIVSHLGVDKYMEGVYDKGWVIGKGRDLCASYELAYDDKAPSITPIGQNTWNSSHFISLNLSDDGSGIDSFEGYIDGKFILFTDNIKSQLVRCNLKDTPIKRTGKKRNFEFIVKDKRNNKSIYKTFVIY